MLRNDYCGSKCFPVCGLKKIFFAEAKFASRVAKLFLNLFRNILLSQQMFRRLSDEETFREINFPQLFPRLRVPLRMDTI